MRSLGRWITNGTAKPFWARKVFEIEKVKYLKTIPYQKV